MTGWPPETPQHFRDVWHSHNGAALPRWEGNSAQEAFDSIFQLLNVANGISLDRSEVCAWANEQWCQRDPSRCRTSSSQDLRLVAQRNASYVGDSMQWATPFWKMWNAALIDGEGREDGTPAGVMGMFVNVALWLVSGSLGCVDPCFKHFKQLLEQYPVENIGSWRSARVWLWRVHNESRSSGRTVPYYEIAKINSWEQLTDEEIHEIIEGELRA